MQCAKQPNICQFDAGTVSSSQTIACNGRKSTGSEVSQGREQSHVACRDWTLHQGKSWSYPGWNGWGDGEGSWNEFSDADASLLYLRGAAVDNNLFCGTVMLNNQWNHGVCLFTWNVPFKVTLCRSQPVHGLTLCCEELHLVANHSRDGSGA